MTETLQERLIRHEGLVLHPYKDSLGKLTIGVGRCLATQGISETEAMFLLLNDITAAREDVAKALPWSETLDAPRREVLIEMRFQLGLAGLLAFHQMLSALRGGDYETAADEMENSQWHSQTPERCEELAEIIRTGKP